MTKEARKDSLIREQEKLWENIRKYERYQSLPEEKDAIRLDIHDAGADVSALDDSDVREFEARYAAITTSMSQELQELEDQERRSAKRHQNANEELVRLREKYGLKAGEWKDIVYSRKEEQHQESMLKNRQEKIVQKQRLWNEEDKKIALILQRRDDRKEEMRKECGQDIPLSEDKIQNMDFAARKNKLDYEKAEFHRQGESLKGRLKNYDENLTALSEYNDFMIITEVEWEQDFAAMDGRKLREFKGMLIRDYNQSMRRRQEEKEHLTHVLNRIVRLEDFQEDFYKKPLEAMLELTDDSSQVLLQLSTTIQSYDSLMEKLKVDVSLVEQEKNNIVGLLEDYVKEVHGNLGKNT